MKKTLLFSSLLLFAGCINRDFNSESDTTSASSGRAESAARTISGCYQGRIDPSATGQLLLKSSRVCIEHTPNSRSGAFTFQFFGSDAKLVNSIGVNLSVEQPRCPGCYAFEGLETKISYNRDSTQKVLLSLMEKYPPKGSYSWSLTRENDSQSKPSTSARCYVAKTKMQPRTVNTRLGGSQAVCINEVDIQNSKSFAFEFSSSAKKNILTLNVNLSQSQPRCPGCFDYEGSDARINYRENKSAGEVVLSVFDKVDNAQWEFQLSPQ